MERYSIDATSNGNMSQSAMLNSSVAAANKNPSRPNFTCSYPLEPHSRDVSFSSYLRPKDEKQQGKVADSELNIFEAKRYFNEIQDQKELNKNVSSATANLRNDDTPMANPRLSSVSSVDGASTNYGRNKSGSFHATPTVSSEASWNSQSGLLSNPPGSIAVSMNNLRLDEKKKTSRASSSSKWFFGRKCPCTGKKSLQVEEDISEHNTSTQAVQLTTSTSFKKQSFSSAGEDVYIKATMDFEREKTHTIGGTNNRVKVQEVGSVNDTDHEFLPRKHWNRSFSKDTTGGGGGGAGAGAGVFSFPVLNPPIDDTKANLNAGKPVLMMRQQPEDPPRESLEVFQPKEEPISLRKSTDLQRLMSFPEESDRRSFNYPGSPKNRPIDDDVVSDASSDLFEIESFSTQSTMFPMYRPRDSLDETSSSMEGRRYGGIGAHFRRSLDETTTPSIAPTECYEPSEVSIDWSVTTAEGFDRGSVTAPSDYEDNRFMNNIDTKRIMGTGMSQSTSKRKGNGLFSCRYEKAVNIGPHPVKCVSLEQHHQVGGKYGVESGRINPAMSTRMMMHKGNGNKLPFARSVSARMSYNQALTTRS